LEQEFNSLDAQRESAEAFIRSQTHEGWTCLPDRYDDGGYTGGNMERPALQRLLADIRAGKIDCVVTYKVDRLSRSLPDFARMMETFERHGASFVSITQQFNSANPYPPRYPRGGSVRDDWETLVPRARIESLHCPIPLEEPFSCGLTSACLYTASLPSLLDTCLPGRAERFAAREGNHSAQAGGHAAWSCRCSCSSLLHSHTKDFGNTQTGWKDCCPVKALLAFLDLPCVLEPLLVLWSLLPALIRRARPDQIDIGAEVAAALARSFAGTSAVEMEINWLEVAGRQDSLGRDIPLIADASLQLIGVAPCPEAVPVGRAPDAGQRLHLSRNSEAYTQEVPVGGIEVSLPCPSKQLREKRGDFVQSGALGRLNSRPIRAKAQHGKACIEDIPRCFQA
jgi:hypothetical protein